METSPEMTVADVGRKLGHQARPSKDFLVKHLRQAAKALSGLQQLSSLEQAIGPLRESLVRHRLTQHKDKDVRVLVAICYCEILRVLAPDPSLGDEIFMEIFELFVSMFKELADVTSPFFPWRVKILETVAKLKCCQRLLDVRVKDSAGLILDMFNTFFNVVRIDHQRSLIDSILSIMTLIIKEEEVSLPLLDVIVQNLRHKGKGTPSCSNRLASDLVQSCRGKLEPAICGYLSSCILEKDSVHNKLRDSYHDIIYEIFRFLPHVLLPIIPFMTQELLAEQVDVRLKSVNLIGKVLSLPKENLRDELNHLFIELLKRFSDKVAEVRISAIRAVKACYLANPYMDHHGILASFEGRLLDSDSRVRMEAVIAVCHIAKCNLKNFPAELIIRATDRLRDKVSSVRKEAFHKLMEVYQLYCSMCCEGKMELDANFEQIPCKTLMLFYDKNAKELSPLNLEVVLAQNLFPIDLQVEERTQHWIFMYSLFTSTHEKAFKSILFHKRRFQMDMRAYLSHWKTMKEQENDSGEGDSRTHVVMKRISLSFSNHADAEECFKKFNKMNDDTITEALLELLDETDFGKAVSLRDMFLRRIGDNNSCYKFLELLFEKCTCSLFGSEHVYYIVDHISRNRGRESLLRVPAINLLEAIITNFPSLLRGSESQFKTLVLEEDSVIGVKLLQILSRAAPYISMSLIDIYPLLERWCLEGSRAQCKASILAVSSFPSPSTQLVFAKLCQKLVASLHCGRNIPSVLKSLGCIAEHSISTFQGQMEEISSCIREKIFSVPFVDDSSPSDEDYKSNASFGCKVKIYGVKTLVKGFLVNKVNHEPRQINHLLYMLSDLLQKGEFSNCYTMSERDRAHVRLAAAKSLLRLSGRWDLHIAAQLFRSIVMIAKDSTFFVRKIFLEKVHFLLNQHAIPMRYACAFLLASSDCHKDLQNASFQYLQEFIKDFNRAAQAKQTSTTEDGCMVDSPVYVVVFLLHVLAHDIGFPADDSLDDEVSIHFFRPLSYILHSLISTEYIDGDSDCVKRNFLYLLCILRAVKRAEDAVDVQKTSNMHLLADIGLTILNALKPNGVNLAHAPGLVLLPSSLYRTSRPKILQEQHKCRVGFGVHENFVKKLVEPFQSKFGQLTTSSRSYGQKFQKDATESSFSEHSVIELKTHKQFKSLINRDAVDNDVNGMDTTNALVSRKHGKIAGSPVSSGPLCFTDNTALTEKKEINYGHSRNVARKDLQPVIDLVCSELSEVESEVLTQDGNALLLPPQNEERKRKNNCYFPEILDHSKTKLRSSGMTMVSSCSFSEQSASCKDQGEDSSLDILSETVFPSRDNTFPQRASMSNEKVFLDSTNLLTANHLNDHCQSKHCHVDVLKNSAKPSARRVVNGNRDKIALRSRRRKA